MKTKRFWMALSALAVLAGCAKVSESELDAPVKEDSGKMIIHATYETDATKTVLQSDGSVFWNPGDQIAVFFNTVKVPFTSYNKADAASAYFVGNTMITTGSNEGAQGGVGGDYTYWGLYPYSVATRGEIFFEFYNYSGTSYSGFYGGHNPQYSFLGLYALQIDGSYLSSEYFDSGEYYDMMVSPASSNASQVGTYLFNWQRGKENSFDSRLNIALAKSDDYKELAFYNVLGGIRFSVNRSDITKVVFRGNNNEDLAGYLVMEMDANGKPKVSRIIKGEKEISVSLEGDQPFKPGVWYYAMMVPTTLTKGYTMEVYTQDKMAQKVVNSSTEVKRSVFGSLEKVDSGLNFNTSLVHLSTSRFYLYATQNFGPNYGTFTWNLNNGSPFGSYYGGLNLLAGDSCKLSIYEDNGTPAPSGLQVKWLIADPTVVSIASDGTVKALAPGYSSVLCWVDSRFYSFSVDVSDANGCYDFKINGPSREMYVGDTMQLEVVTVPEDAAIKPVWRSENEKVATVDQNGLVTALQDGWAYIYAQIGNRERSYDIRIRPADEKPVEGNSAWSVIGYLSNYDTSWDHDFVAVDLGDGIYVVKNMYLYYDDQFKWRKDRDWSENRGGYFPRNLNAGFPVYQDGEDIRPELRGYFDIYYNANLEQVAICERGVKPVWSVITIDGNFDDWDLLDPSRVTTVQCANYTVKPDLKLMKVYADKENVFIYVEFDFSNYDYIEMAHFDILINGDNNTATGGYMGSWDQGDTPCIDILAQGTIFYDGYAEYYDPGIYRWAGGDNNDGWVWEDTDISDFICGYGNDRAYEFQIRRENYPIGKLADPFTMGVDILVNGWDPTGALPNAEITSDNPSGKAPLLEVKIK